MSKKFLTALAIGFSMVSVGFAHDFWVSGSNEKQFEADIGYGHDFPHPEEIAAARVVLFSPLSIISKDDKKVLKQEGKNYHYVGDKLAKGSYILTGEYKPTFWVKDSKGKWSMDKNKKDSEDIKYCEVAQMLAKGIIDIEGANDEFVTKPINQVLEIIPLDTPSNFKVDKPFKVQVLFEGKPLKTAEVKGTFDGFLKDKKAFLGTTDLEGKIEILALKPGKWVLSVEHTSPYKDLAVCDENVIVSTLTFDVK